MHPSLAGLFLAIPRDARSAGRRRFTSPVALKGTWAGLLLTAFAMAMTGCAGGPRTSGFDAARCAAEASSCDLGQLDERQRAQVLAARTEAHYQDCLAGGRCNVALLPPARQARVNEAVSRLNLDACLRGESGCRESALSAPERERAREAARARNVEFCVAGLTACDPVPLGDDERARVRAAYLERNYRNCMSAVGTFLDCNLNELTPAQQAQVQRRNLAVNEYVCMNALMGCIEEMLNDEQRARRAALRPAALR